MRSTLLWSLLACTCAYGLQVQAQVVRCTDPHTGKVSYTDGRCEGGTQAQEIEGRKTAEEIQAERALAAEALARKQQRLEIEAAEQRLEAARERDARARRPAAPAPSDYANSQACTQSRQNLELQASRMNNGALYEDHMRLQAAQRQMNLDCLGPERAAQVEANTAAQQALQPAPVYVLPPSQLRPPRPPGMRPPPPPPEPAPKPPITHCNVFRCYDSQGGVHPIR